MPSVRFGARAALAALALGLVALPFGLLLLLVRDRWDPLLDLDQGASDGLHGFALHHDWFVTVLKGISTVGSAIVYWPLFAALAVWLLARGLPRLAPLVAAPLGPHPGLHTPV